MRLNTLTSILVTVTAVQAEPVRRDTIFPSVLRNIADAMTNADNHVLEYQGGDPTALRQAAMNLYHVINESIPISVEMAPLTESEIEGFQDLSDEVYNLGDKYLTDLVTAIPLIAANGLCGRVYEYVVSLGSKSNEFFTTAISKFPADLQDEAAMQVDAVNDSFTDAQEALAPGVCTNENDTPTTTDAPSAATSVTYGTPTPTSDADGGQETTSPVPVPEGRGSVVSDNAPFALIVAIFASTLCL
ncbi:hypothetical protein GGR50DRAFT_703465 [Xylaria sp. CBS 124048]|nr:hypothetical protein GGR50DRAFT_703465 [Xylaria sp. CBS 124048]